MACEPPHHRPACATPAGDTTSPVQRLRPPIAAKFRPKIAALNRSESRPGKRRATFVLANHVKSSPEPAARRFSSTRAARIAKEQELAALCQRRASQWAGALREGLDPDIARFVRDQAAAWRLLATSCARSARDALGEAADPQ
jgi:hypothetical protein